MAAMQNPLGMGRFSCYGPVHKNTGNRKLPDVDNVKGGALAAA